MLLFFSAILIILLPFLVLFDEKLRKDKSNWLRHVTRMNNNRMSKIMLNYRQLYTIIENYR
jgi:hypothetical protein